MKYKYIILVIGLILPVLSFGQYIQCDTVNDIIFQKSKIKSYNSYEKNAIQSIMGNMLDSLFEAYLPLKRYCDTCKVTTPQINYEYYSQKFFNSFENPDSRCFPAFVQPARNPDDCDSLITLTYLGEFKLTPYQLNKKISPKQLMDSIFSWFPNGISSSKVDNFSFDDNYYIYEKSFLANVNCRLEFYASGTPNLCDDATRRFDLRVWFVMSEATDTLANQFGKIPLNYKIRYIEICKNLTDQRKPRDASALATKDFWAFANFRVNSGIASNNYSDVIPDYENLSIGYGLDIGAQFDINLFFGDTTRTLNKQERSQRRKLWSKGLGIGLGFTRSSWQWNLDTYTNRTGASLSPVNNLPGNYTLLTDVSKIQERIVANSINVPIYFELIKKFERKRNNYQISNKSLYIDAGATFSYLLSSSFTVPEGSISYSGEDYTFINQNDTISGILIDNLPYYGFGTYDAKTDGSDNKDLYQALRTLLSTKAGFHFSSPAHPRSFWKVGLYFNYSLTNFRSENSFANTISPEGKITDLSNTNSKLYPYSFGLELAYSFNFLENNLKSIKPGKVRKGTGRHLKQKEKVNNPEVSDE